MQKVFNDIIERLEEEKSHYYLTIANTGDEKLDAIYEAVANAIDTNILIVNQVAEKYKSTEHINCSTDSSTDKVCEWKPIWINARLKYKNCEFEMDHVNIFKFKYCPYCGKKLSIDSKGE